MKTTDYSRVYDIFRGALALKSNVREDFLSTACGDQGLRGEVEALLEWHESNSGKSDEVIESMVTGAFGSLIPERIGDYRIEGILGAGGMGIVYRAVQDQPHRMVALKVLHHAKGDALITRFRQESEALGRLRHHGIAQIYSAGSVESATGPLSYFVMELVDGPELTTYREAKRLAPEDILELTAQICDAVDYAHGEGVIHRDLKPANILVDREGIPRILDFGVARIIDLDRDIAAVTEDGAVVGTVSYMSPEQAAGRTKDIGPWSDVYAIGVMLYEMLAGRRPIEFQGLSFTEALSLIESAEPPALEKLEARLAGDVSVIVGKALEKDPNHRYRSAAELAADIRRYLNHEPIVARPPSTFYHVSRFVRRHRLAVAMVAVLAIATPIVTGLGAFVWARLPDLREHEKTQAGRRLESELEIAFHDFHEKKTEEAAARFAAILEEHPDSKEAFAGETFVRYYLNDDEAVLDLVDEGSRRFEESGTLQKIGADVLWRAGKKEEAREIVLAAGEPTEAAEWFIEGYRNILQARIAGKRNAEGQKFYRTAEENLLRSIAASNAPRRAYYFALAEAIGSQEEARTKLDFHKVLVTRWPDSDRAWWWAAFVATGGEDTLAIEYYEEFLRRRPDDMEVHNNLGTVLRNLGRDDEAEAQFRRAMEIDPNHINPPFNLGRLEESRGNLEAAIELYRGIIEIHPQDARTHSELAGVYHKMKRLDEAISSIREAARLDPLLATTHQNHAVIASTMDRHEEAIAAIREAIALNPGNAHNHSIHSDVLRKAKRSDEALAALKLAVRLDPGSALDQSNLAAAYIDQKKFAEAAAAARQSIKNNPNRAAAYFNLGSALSNLGQRKEAIAAFKRCLDLDPNHGYARVEYEKQRAIHRTEEAGTQITGGETVDGKSIVAMMDRGYAAARGKDFAEAAKIFRRVVKLDPKNVQAHFMLGHYLMSMKQNDASIAAYDAALAIEPSHIPSGYQRAALLSNLNRIPESIAAYRTLLRYHPKHPESHCNLGSLLRGKGKLEESLAMYRRGHELGRATKSWQYPSADWVVDAAVVLIRELVRKGERSRATDVLDEYEALFPDREKLKRERLKLEAAK